MSAPARATSAHPALVALLLTACSGGCHETPPAFEPLQRDLAAFQTLDATLAWTDPDRGGRMVVELHATPDTVHLAQVQGGGGEVDWSEDRGVRVGGDDLSIPVPSLNPQAEELWEELRDGFEGSTWSERKAPSRAPLSDPKGVTWADLDLPFDWARNVDVAIGVGDAGMPRYLVLEDKEPPLEITAQMLRGGPRTVTLSESGRLWMVVDAWEITR